MKAHLLLCLLLLPAAFKAQITTPQVKANFGVDADQKANYFYSSQLSGSDDWFINNDPGGGVHIIDTTNATAVYNQYLANPASRNYPLVRRMTYAPFSKVNNRLWMDAVFVRDYHGNDSTVYAAGSNKNGMNPADWSSPVSQSTPDKNEILDVFMHVRRDGTTAADSLWMFAAVSIQNTTGNRYFDFEMYQSDIFYDMNTHVFSGYGPDAGHTSWQFDAAGNIIKAGDIILTSEYGSAGLTLIEARIWVNKDAMMITPNAFDWGGLFDGANNSAQYGYASIEPKAKGAFYNGLQCTLNTWGGPFGIVYGDNTLGKTYKARQFMEFSVNLSKLGLDPVTLLGGTTCDRPFQKVMVKTRASTSFTAELKDFVGPFSFFTADSASLFTDVPVFCGVIGVSNIRVTNANPSYVYNWSTPNGHILDTTDKTSIYVDAPGTYIVHQKLNSDCPVYSTDTITITFDGACGILLNNSLAFKGQLQKQQVLLSWNRLQTKPVDYYELQRSTDGIRFKTIGQYTGALAGNNLFEIADNIQYLQSHAAYYRLKIVNNSQQVSYSKIIYFDLSNADIRSVLTIQPNPVKDKCMLSVFSPVAGKADVTITDAAGRSWYTASYAINKNTTALPVTLPNNTLPGGIYFVRLTINNNIPLVKKILVSR
jgi:hypothetical protein